MNKEKLLKKRDELVERFNKATSQLKGTEEKIQQSLVEKDNIVAHLNALKGAVEVIDQLLCPEDEAEVEEVK